MPLSPNWWMKKDPVTRFAWACLVDSLEDYAIGMLDDEGSGLRIDDSTGDLRCPTLLLCALSHGRERIARRLLALGDTRVNAECISHLTPLWHASWLGYTEIVQMLLLRGVRADHVPGSIPGIYWNAVEGKTPLHCAAVHGYLEIAGLLVDHGADINSHQYRMPPPIFLAAVNNYQDVMWYLAEMGADFSLTDYSGQLLVDYLEENQRSGWRTSDKTISLARILVARQLSAVNS